MSIFCVLYFHDMLYTPKKALFNPHMHEMSFLGAKHYIFGDQFYSENASKLRLMSLILHFHAREHMIS